jgi:predicted dienelactone hydrolase
MDGTAIATLHWRWLAWKPVIAALIGLAAAFGLYDVATASFLDALVVVSIAAAAIWWITARDRGPLLLNRLSLAVLATAVFARVVQGPRWQMWAWQLVAAMVAASAGLRLWRPGHSIKLTRILGRILLILGLLIGYVALMVEPVPTLPAPSGEFHVGSQVFQWTDASRSELLTADARDMREVVAQAWYPSDVSTGPSTAYIGTDNPASLTAGISASVFEGFDGIDTHATNLSAVSVGRAKWPVLLFSPGLSVARQSYSALAAELASRGYVVITMSHPYDSPATQLANGHLVTSGDSRDKRSMEDGIALRAADSSFVLDQLQRLNQVAPQSPLVGHLDLDGVGILGHSFGGATAVQVIGKDPRFAAGLNIDGRLFGRVPQLNRPFLWLQSSQSGALEGQDALLDGLRAGGELVRVEGTAHQSFSDVPAYLTPFGRQTLGRVPMLGPGSVPVEVMTPITADIVTAFFGPIVGGANDGTLSEVARRHPSVVLLRSVVPR